MSIVATKPEPVAERPGASRLGFTVSLAVESKAALRYKSLTIVSSSAPPCTSGVEEGGVWVDGKLSADKAVPPGSHSVELEFPLQRTITTLREPSSLDLRIEGQQGDTTCSRIELTDASAREQWTGSAPWVAGDAARFGIGSDTSPNQFVYLVLEAGGWVGPLQIGGELGLGAGFDRCTGDCGDRNTRLLAGVGPFIKYYPVQIQRFVLGLNVGYHLMLESNGPATLVHAPRLALEFSLLPEQIHGWPHNPRQGSAGIELFVEEWIANRGAGAQASPLFGLGFFFQMPEH